MKAQLARLPEWLEHFAALAQASEGSVPPFSDANHLNYVRRVPLGVCALLTPFNHPLLICLKKLAVSAHLFDSQLFYATVALGS